MTEKNDVIKLLSAELSDDAIQRAPKEKTKKGYDTTGYGYQYCVDRLNEVLGEKWGFNYDILEDNTGEYSTGTPYREVTVNVNIWINDKENIRSCVGGHTSITFADALKGAITNGFKKTAAFWGVGAKAYRGDIDDDNQLLPESHEKKTTDYNNNSVCPNCKTKLYKDSKRGGYFCWKKKGGCGKRFTDDLRDIDSDNQTGNLPLKNGKQPGNMEKLKEAYENPDLALDELYDLIEKRKQRTWTTEDMIYIEAKETELELKLNPFAQEGK